MKKLLILFLLFLPITVSAQFTYGTSGLLRMPSADMNEMGTIILGANHLDGDATAPHRYGYSTDAVYLNATLLPWVEVSYYMMFRSGTQKHWDNYISQDRSLHVKFRVWKEGYLKSWMPQIAIGANDPFTHSNSSGDVGVSSEDGNSHLSRYYIAFTKHFRLKNIAVLGAHFSGIYYNEDESGTKGVRPAIGADLHFATAGTSFFQKALNGLTIAAEFDGRTPNVGGSYGIWKNHIMLYGELNKCQYPSAGIQFRIRAYK